jgi:hypothetical protein
VCEGCHLYFHVEGLNPRTPVYTQIHFWKIVPVPPEQRVALCKISLDARQSVGASIVIGIFGRLNSMRRDNEDVIKKLRQELDFCYAGADKWWNALCAEIKAGRTNSDIHRCALQYIRTYEILIRGIKRSLVNIQAGLSA